VAAVRSGAAVMSGYEVFELGDVPLQSGHTLHDARLGYRCHGRLNEDGTNAVVVPTFYAGRHADYEAMIGPGRALDPDRYFIVVVDMFGNGVSSSPSNTPAPFNGPKFPALTHVDNVRCQHRLLTDKLGVREIALATGFSMGGQQANHWAALYPDMVRRLAPWCGSARTSPHNWVFLEGVKAALVNAIDFHEGWYAAPPVRGIRAFARVWAGWGPSQAFYRDGTYRQLGHSSPNDHVVAFWESNFLAFDANDLLTMLDTWQRSDISDNDVFGGDYRRACRAITADTVLLPGATDLYFPVEDNRIQKQYMRHASLKPIPSRWGHIAGAPGLNPDDMAFLDRALRELLEREGPGQGGPAPSSKRAKRRGSNVAAVTTRESLN
jgi:homoserine O-acetyltransferase